MRKEKGERRIYVWLNKKENQNHLFTIAPLSHSKNGWPVDDFFEGSAEDFTERYQNAKIVGRTTYNTDNYSIPFLHIGIELDDHNEGHSWGVVELDSMQLQIQIAEYLDDVSSTNNFLQEDIKTILETMEFEE